MVLVNYFCLGFPNSGFVKHLEGRGTKAVLDCVCVEEEPSNFSDNFLESIITSTHKIFPSILNHFRNEEEQSFLMSHIYCRKDSAINIALQPQKTRCGSMKVNIE